MKLSEAIKNVIKTKENEGCADIDAFAQALNIDLWFGWNEEWDNRVKGYWLIKWLCTDTYVGQQVYFFDGQPVAVGFQSARKSAECVQFMSKDAAEKIREFLFQLAEEEEYSYPIVDQEEELEDFYSFDLTDYFTDKSGFVDGKPVEIINKRWFADDDQKRWVCENALVRFEDGEEKVVHAEDIKFPLRVNVNTIDFE